MGLQEIGLVGGLGDAVTYAHRGKILMVGRNKGQKRCVFLQIGEHTMLIALRRRISAMPLM